MHVNEQRSGLFVPGEQVLVAGLSYRVKGLVLVDDLSELYLASDLRLERAVLLRVLRRERLSDLDAFRSTAELLSKLQHRNLATVLQFGQASTGHWVVVFEDQADRLSSELGRKRQLSVARALAVVSDLLCVLELLIDRGYTCRTLSPGVVLIDSYGTPVLFDTLRIERSATAASISAAKDVAELLLDWLGMVRPRCNTLGEGSYLAKRRDGEGRGVGWGGRLPQDLCDVLARALAADGTCDGVTLVEFRRSINRARSRRSWVHVSPRLLAAGAGSIIILALVADVLCGATPAGRQVHEWLFDPYDPSSAVQYVEQLVEDGQLVKAAGYMRTELQGHPRNEVLLDCKRNLHTVIRSELTDSAMEFAGFDHIQDQERWYKQFCKSIRSVRESTGCGTLAQWAVCEVDSHMFAVAREQQENACFPTEAPVGELSTWAALQSVVNHSPDEGHRQRAATRCTLLVGGEVEYASRIVESGNPVGGFGTLARLAGDRFDGYRLPVQKAAQALVDLLRSKCMEPGDAGELAREQLGEIKSRCDGSEILSTFVQFPDPHELEEEFRIQELNEFNQQIEGDEEHGRWSSALTNLLQLAQRCTAAQTQSFMLDHRIEKAENELLSPYRDGLEEVDGLLAAGRGCEAEVRLDGLGSEMTAFADQQHGYLINHNLLELEFDVLSEKLAQYFETHQVSVRIILGDARFLELNPRFFFNGQEVGLDDSLVVTACSQTVVEMKYEPDNAAVQSEPFELAPGGRATVEAVFLESPGQRAQPALHVILGSTP